MERKILTLEPEKCTGCRICELACSFAKSREFNPLVSRVKILKSDNEGVSCPIVCVHCEDPPCRVVCPVEAIVRDDKTKGILIREDVCIGCRACLIVCPYGAISMDGRKGTMLKCDLCEGNPVCVKMCPTDAIRYVRADLVDFSKKHAMMKKITEGVVASRKIVSRGL